jgi:hypothetical protein
MFGSVAEEIRNGLDLLPVGHSHSELGQIVELERSAVSSFLSNSREINFISTLKFAKLLHPRTYIHIVEKWGVFNRKPENVKFTLEFLSANRMLETLKGYITTLKNEEDTSKQILELIELYELMIKYQSEAVVSEDFIDEINGTKALKPEAKFVKEMLKVYYYNDMADVSKLKKHIPKAKSLLKDVSKEALRDVYVVRLYEMESTFLLFGLNDGKAARYVSEKVLNKLIFFGASFEARHYYRVGMSYFYESADMCTINLKKAIATYKNTRGEGTDGLANGIRDNELNLANIHWGLVASLDEVKGTNSEAHYYAKEGEFDKSKAVVETLNHESPFTKLYKGMAESNPFLLLESLKNFIDKGNRFYANLPLMALENYPEAKSLANSILN